MMPRVATIFCTLLLVSACDQRTRLDPDAEFCGLTGPKLRVPTFTIRVTLSPAAEKKLKDAGETIKGLIGFDGDGTPKKDEYTAPDRPVILGCYQFEIAAPGDVSVADAYISAEAATRLTDQDYYVTINVFSGRRAFKDNVLRDGFAEVHISQAAKAPVQITCTLPQ